MESADQDMHVESWTCHAGHGESWVTQDLKSQDAHTVRKHPAGGLSQEWVLYCVTSFMSPKMYKVDTSDWLVRIPPKDLLCCQGLWCSPKVQAEPSTVTPPSSPIIALSWAGLTG